MAFDHCIDGIIKASGESLTREDLQPRDSKQKGILDQIEADIRKRMRQNPAESYEQAAAAVGQEMASAKRIAAIIEKRQRAINVQRKLERQEVLDAAPQTKKMKALNGLSVGRTGGGWGAARSADAMGKALTGKVLINPMMNRLKRSGLIKLLRDRGFQKQAFFEGWRLTDPDHPQLVKAGSKEATEAGKIIGQAVEMGRKMQNQAGAWIGKLPGYVFRQDHDMMRIRYAAGDGLAQRAADRVRGKPYDWEANFEAWKNDFLQWVDHDKTFDDPEDLKEVNAYLEYLFNSFSTGRHERANGGDDWLMGFKGPSNKAKKVSSHRSIHFKGPEEAWAYHEKYGRGDLMEAVQHGLEKAGKNTALMRIWGTNPQAAFDAELDQLTSLVAQSGDVRASDNLKGTAWAKALFAQTNGTANIGGNPDVAAVTSFIRGWQTLASLGQITVSAITDIPLTAGTLRYGGLGYFEAVGNQLNNLFGGYSPEFRAEMMEQLGVMMEGTLGAFGARFTSEDGARGVMAATLQTFFKYGGIRWWTDNMKSGVALGASWKLGQLSGKAWDELPLQLRANFERYQIGAREWDLVRQAQHVEHKGRRFLTSDGVKNLPDEAIAGYLGKPEASAAELDRARDSIATNMSIYFTDLADEAVNQPGAYERAVTSWGLPSGTVPGEVARAFMQFKGFGISATRRHFWREVTRTGQIDKMGIVYLMVGTTTMGYAAMQLKALANAKTPRALPTDIGQVADQALASFLQGGGAGIYGDFLFGDTNRYGSGFAETFGGPTLGTIANLYKLKSQIQEGKDVGATAIRTIKNALPFQNFLWTKLATDYLIFYGLQEAMNPGYLRRMESRVKKENQQTFILPPSRSAVRY